MLDRNELLCKIDSMDQDQLLEIMAKAFDAAGIPYEKKPGQITLAGIMCDPENAGMRPSPEFTPPATVGKTQTAELDGLYAAVRTIRAFCRGREHCVQDFGKDLCPIYRCCDLLPKDWLDAEERMQKG